MPPAINSDKNFNIIPDNLQWYKTSKLRGFFIVFSVENSALLWYNLHRYLADKYE